MIAVSFSQLDGWLAFVYLAAVVGVTIRLLRNLDAFALEVQSGAPEKSGATDEDDALEESVGEESGQVAMNEGGRSE